MQKRLNTAFETVAEAERALEMQTNDLIKLRATPGVAAALAAAEGSHHPRVQDAGAATENAAKNALGAYIHAAQDWPRISHYKCFGNCAVALQAAAQAAAAAAAFQRAAQAEAGGQRATERFASLEGDPPKPDSNERIAKEWLVAVRVGKCAVHEAERRYAAARVRHEDAKEASQRVGAAWAARLAKQAQERVDDWKASGAPDDAHHAVDWMGPVELVHSPISSGPEHEHVSSGESGSEDSEPEHEAAAELAAEGTVTDSELFEDRPAPEPPVPGPPAAVAKAAGQKRVAGKAQADTRCHKKKRSDSYQ